MKFEYKCTKPFFVDSTKVSSPVMENEHIEEWLNEMDSRGWEFVSYGQKHWRGSEPFTQEFWIFRRPRQ